MSSSAWKKTTNITNFISRKRAMKPEGFTPLNRQKQNSMALRAAFPAFGADQKASFLLIPILASRNAKPSS
jgi:hypothetical protein